MTSGKITIGRKGHILLMGLNRPEKMNAFDVDMYLEIAAAFGELDRDRELRCGLHFAYGKHFTAGLELPKWAPFFSGERHAIPAHGRRDLCRRGDPVIRGAQGREIQGVLSGRSAPKTGIWG
jgi:enoyl-CoA hydratase